jgi:hypothetical protein
MHRPVRVLTTLVIALVAGAGMAQAHTDGPIVLPLGTPVLDGVRGEGEWPGGFAVFPELPGSVLYLMNDGANLYLGLWVPDSTLSTADILNVRFDGAHNGTLDWDDDEVRVTGNSTFKDTHYEFFWGMTDVAVDGYGIVAQGDGGNFFELSHPFNSGHTDDIGIVPGDTLGICVGFTLDGLPNLDLSFPVDCISYTHQQTKYADLLTSGGGVASVELPVNSSIGLMVHPNPIRGGERAAISFAVPSGGADVRMGVYNAAGRLVTTVADGFYPEDRHVLHWNARDVLGSATGVYFLKTVIGGQVVASRLLIVR